MGLKLLLVVLASFFAVPQLRGDIAVFLAEPYGAFGKMNPTGHAAVYLSRVCAESPTVLRRCAPGEPGAVISRYHRIAGYDWLAIPLIPYLYAVDDVADVPLSADAATVALLRNEYRRRHLSDLLENESREDWVQLVGASYDRRIFAFEIATSEAQDDAFIEAFNARRNTARFNLFFRNCADLVREIVNFYFPKVVRRSIVADTGITTPKQVAKSLLRHSKKHPELDFSVYAIPQIPGSVPRSRDVRGVLEGLVKSKKYAVPLIALDIWFAPGIIAGYLTTGRFNPARYVESVYHPAELHQRVLSRSTMPDEATPQPSDAIAQSAPHPTLQEANGN